MLKKTILGSLMAFLLIPTVALASPTTGTTDTSIVINPGDSGFTQLINNDLFFQPYTISSTRPNQLNTSTHTFSVADYSGGLDGWTVTTLLSDFTLDIDSNGSVEDRLSDHNATIDLNCNTTSFYLQTHGCSTNINRALTSSGTAPSVIVAAPANTTSVGEFGYTIPTGFFALKFDNTIKKGTYEGTMTIDFSSVYTP